MRAPLIPANERARLALLGETELLGSEREERFDRLTRIAKAYFNVPIVLVTLLDQNRQWFKSCIGLDVDETPRNVSFCGHTILSDQVLLVHDALQDPRFADNPLVLEAPRMRFYAGAPLTVRDNVRFGSFCIIDTIPRMMSDTDVQVLRDLADCAIDEIRRSLTALGSGEKPRPVN